MPAEIPTTPVLRSGLVIRIRSAEGLNRSTLRPSAAQWDDLLRRLRESVKAK